MSAACTPQATSHSSTDGGDGGEAVPVDAAGGDATNEDAVGTDATRWDAWVVDTAMAVDCNGVPGGGAVEDNCGTCDADPSNDCLQDCNGDWGGSAVLDNCGTCDADPGNDCLQDCNGDWGGSAAVDNCGTCDADPNNDCLQDCNGVWGGSTPGCYKDPTSNLGWEQTPSAGTAIMGWDAAVAHCQNASTAGFDDWFLPSVQHMRSLFRGCPETMTGGSCVIVVNGTSCYGCANNQGPAAGCYWPSGLAGTCGDYWTATLAHDQFNYKWIVAFTAAGIDVRSTNMQLMVLCARTVQ